ncbi:hypothetical protein HBN50_14970 [Halobacteriovorax sp. GB3]|uniref:hypothetical protein n=1 Tax=Halobacteriovorax sp. GB3 TaxID=2719615 RepID=UPI002361C5F3|nr:hypothetical protein [Halobacteriovorax sp. GB3]MDD0854412.1 hypothetical protein [Halobacteriovorax sp. GB3]
MRLLKNLSLISTALSLTFSSAFALDFEDAVFPELATSGRALAMGNAYIAKVDDSSSVFYNPAGLGTVRFPHLHLSNLHLEVNKGWLKTGAGGSITDAAGNITKGFSIDGTRQLLKDNPGHISHSRFNFLPNFTARYISFGYLLSIRQKASLSSETGSQFKYAWRRDHGPYVGINVSLFGGVFKIGSSVTWLMRKESLGESDPDITIELGEADYYKGSAAIINSGVKLTLPVQWLPTFAANMHNATEQDFGNASGKGKPDKILNSMDLGFSVTPQIGKLIRWHWEVNWKDFGSEYEGVSTKRKLTLGSELDIARTFFLRFGYGDGFGSAGLGIKTRKLEFDLTTYAVENSDEDYEGTEDRRFSMTISSGF